MSEEFEVTFNLNNDNIEATFENSESVNFNALFEIHAQGVNWGHISDDITNQLDLQEVLNTKQDVILDLEEIRIEAEYGASAFSTISLYGDIVTHDVSEFATASQGTLADSALQPNDNISELVNDSGYITSSALSGYATETWVGNQGYITGITSSDVTDALGYTPANSSSLATVATSGSYTDLSNKPTIPTVNNATLTIQKNGTNVQKFTANASTDVTANITVPTTASDVGALPSTTTINDLTTTAQQNALNSGATATNIGQITTNENNIADIRDLIPSQATSSNQLTDKAFVNSSIATNTAYFIGTFNSVAELETYSGPLKNNDYAFVATTDAAGNILYDRYKYNADTQQWIFEYELNNSSFTAAQWASINSGITSGDVSLIQTALQPNDNISELVNNAGYITGITSSDVTSALGYTPYNSTNPNGYQANVIETVKVNGTALTPTNKAVDVEILDFYGTCATGASTQTKVVVCPEFTTLKEGASIKVKFTNAQTYNGAPKLNVNSTGAISIVLKGTTGGVRYMWQSGDVVDFVYDGTYWVWGRGGTATTTYYGVTKLATSATSTATATALTPLSLNSLVQNMIEPYPVYSASATYEVGDKVRYGYQAWECNTAITGEGEAWDETHWTPLDPLQTQIDNKQETLISGTNIKTINNQSLLGSGNIDIQGGGTVDQTYDPTSANAQSGAAIAGAGFIKSTDYANSVDGGTIKISSTTGTGVSSAGVLYATNSSYATYTDASNYFVISKGTLENVFANKGFITGITSADVTSALGYTPYNSSNPSGYITSSALNSYLPLSGGTLTGYLYTKSNIDFLSSGLVRMGTIEGVYQEGAGNQYLKVDADSYKLRLGGSNLTFDANNNGSYTEYQLLDATTGLIPDARISSNIARTSAIPDITNLANKSLSNLDNTGQGVIDGKANVDLSNTANKFPNSYFEKLLPDYTAYFDISSDVSTDQKDRSYPYPVVLYGKQNTGGSVNGNELIIKIGSFQVTAVDYSYGGDPICVFIPANTTFKCYLYSANVNRHWVVVVPLKGGNYT